MSVSQAIRYVAPTKTALGALYLSCHVKPNARQGSGVLSVDEEVIELAVSAQAREGEANKAVVGLLASVLKVPKSDVEVVRGMKSREKTVKVESTALSFLALKGKNKAEGVDHAAALVAKVQELLQNEINGQ